MKAEALAIVGPGSVERRNQDSVGLRNSFCVIEIWHTSRYNLPINSTIYLFIVSRKMKSFGSWHTTSDIA